MSPFLRFSVSKRVTRLLYPNRGKCFVAHQPVWGLANLAAPEHDHGALEMSVREAVELGQARARAAADARMST